MRTQQSIHLPIHLSLTQPKLAYMHSWVILFLIHNESTHNFIYDRVAKQLGLHVEPAHSFKALVGNGEELKCTTFSNNVSLLLEQHAFTLDLFVLPLNGVELVLRYNGLRP